MLIGLTVASIRTLAAIPVVKEVSGANLVQTRMGTKAHAGRRVGIAIARFINRTIQQKRLLSWALALAAYFWMKNATRTGGAIGVKKIVGAKRIRHCCDPQRPAMDHWRRLVIEGLQDLLTIAARSGPPFP